MHIRLTEKVVFMPHIALKCESPIDSAPVYRGGTSGFLAIGVVILSVGYIIGAVIIQLIMQV